MKIQNYSSFVKVKMDSYKEKRKEQSKKAIKVEKFPKFRVKVCEKLISKKFHQPFTLTTKRKFREGQKSCRVTKCKFSVGNSRYDIHGRDKWLR